MRDNIRKQLIQIASVILTLASATTAHAISQPIQTARGVFRLGSKTQANVDSKRSSVDLGQGIILVSSNPARMGRPTLEVHFSGAPMHAKVQGTAVIAYLKEEFIQITGVEGRTYLVREGRLGEVVAVDAGKMLLVKPTAKRLPDTVDVNLSDFIKNSPMFNGGLKLAASELIARAIEKQSKNRYLKPTPIYLEGAGTEAVIAEGLGDEGQPFESSLTGIDAISRIPRPVEGAQRGPEQLVALQTGGGGGGGGFNGGPGGGGGGGGGGFNGGGGGGFNGGGGGGFNGGGGGGFNGGGGGGSNGGGGGGIGGINDSPGAPEWGVISTDATEDIFPSRGFQKEFKGPPPEPVAGQPDFGSGSFWFPITIPDEVILSSSLSELGIILEGEPQPFTLHKSGQEGLVQGALAFELAEGGNYIIFPEARIPDASAKTAFKITPTPAGTSNMILKFSNQDIPSDILTSTEFKDSFSPAEATVVVLSDEGRFQANGMDIQTTRVTEETDRFAPLDKVQNPPTLEMTIDVPPEGITIKAPFFKTDTITQPNGPIVGLDAPRFMGSVLVDVTGGGPGVKVEVGDRQGSRALQFPSTDDTGGKSRLGTFSLQAPPSTSVAGGMLTIKSDGPLNITDPNPDPVSSKRSLAQTKIVSQQSVDVQATSGDLELSEAELRANQGIGVRSAGALNFSNTKLNAGQGIEVSSPTRIRFENSSELAAVTQVWMQGGGTAALELVKSTVIATNGEILIDQFKSIQIESALLAASVIRARAMNGNLKVSNSILSARELMRLYAEGGTVEFSGRVTLTGNKIDIAGNTVRVTRGGRVTTGPNTTVYADDHDYNKGSGQIGTQTGAAFRELDAKQTQRPFANKPDF